MKPEKPVVFVPKLSRADGMGHVALLSIDSINRLGNPPQVFCYENKESRFNVNKIPTARDLAKSPTQLVDISMGSDVHQFPSLTFWYARSGDALAPLHALISSQILAALEEADLIYYHLGSFETFGPAALYSKIHNGSNLIVEYHGMAPPSYTESAEARLYRRSALRFGPLILKEADAIIVHSEFIRNECQSLFGVEPTHKIRLGIDLTKFKRTRSSEEAKDALGLSGKKILLYVGRLVKYKRVDFLIKAVKELRKQIPNIMLVIVGIGKIKQYIRLIHDIDVQNEVLVTGFVEDVAPYYEAADLVVTASLHEGFCIPFIEAQAFGIPGVATKACALPETIGDAGLLFETFNLNDFVRKAEKLLTEKERYDRLRRNALSRSQLWNKEIVIRKMKDVILSL